MGNFDERDKREPQPVIIEDKRHGRDSGEDEEPAEIAQDEPAAQPEPAVEQELAGELSSAVAPSASADGPQPADFAADDLADDFSYAEPTEEQLSAAQQAEMAYLMQLFQHGQAAYLRSQLPILLNFAMMHLGRMPNPATGIVAADLEQAKTSIDLLEFILVKVQAQLDPRDRMEFTQYLSELKYTFMQALGNAGGSGGAAAPPAVAG